MKNKEVFSPSQQKTLNEEQHSQVHKMPKIRVLIRKRPLNKKQMTKNEVDIVTIEKNQTVVVHQQKLKVDLTPYIDDYRFNFDGAYNQFATNQQIYNTDVKPLIKCVFQGAKVTCFAYGQTGSGKTHTMLGNFHGQIQVKGLYLLAAIDLFQRLSSYNNLQVWVSFYQIYCGKLYDLLNQKNLLYARQDAKNNVHIVGLSQSKINSAQHLMQIINYGTGIRVTSQNGTNNDSSRSHAILQIVIKQKNNSNKIHGKLSFIDLAGSERAADHADQLEKQTRIDGAQINKSLLALKQCIRALDQNKNHTPFRGSKLTMVLKDSFSGYCKTIMIGNIAPNSSSCQNTLNTLKYADRVKQLKKQSRDRDRENYIQMQKIDQLQKQLMLPRTNLKNTNYNENINKNNLNIQKKEQNFKKKNNFVNVSGMENHISPPLQVKKNNDFMNIHNLKSSKPSQKSPMPFHNKTSPTKKVNLLSSPSSYQNPIKLMQQDQEDFQQFTYKRSPPNKSNPRQKNSQNYTFDDLQKIQEKHEQYIQLILQEEQSLLKTHQNHINDTIQLTKKQMEIKSQVDKIGSSIDQYLTDLDLILKNKLQSVLSLRQKISNIKGHLGQSKVIQQQYIQYSRALNQKFGIMGGVQSMHQQDDGILEDTDDLFIN